MNLCIKKDHALVAHAADALEMTQLECEAIETLAESGFQLDRLNRVIENANFALSWLNSADDKKSVLDILEIEKSCEGLITQLDGELTADAAAEGIGEAVLRAWEAIKAWVKKVFTAIFNLVAAIFGVDASSKVEQTSTQVAETAPAADMLAKQEYEGIKPKYHGSVVRARIDLENQMHDELLRNYALLRERAAEVEASMSSADAARLDERSKAYKEQLDKCTAKQEEYEKRLDELEKQNAALLAKAGDHAMQGWDAATMKAFAEFQKQMLGKNGKLKKVADEIQKTKPVVEKLQKEVDQRQKEQSTSKPTSGNPSDKTPKPQPAPSHNPSPTPPKPPPSTERIPPANSQRQDPGYQDAKNSFIGTSKETAKGGQRMRSVSSWVSAVNAHLKDCCEWAISHVQTPERYAVGLMKRQQKADVKENIRCLNLALNAIVTDRTVEVIKSLQDKMEMRVKVESFVKALKSIVKIARNDAKGVNYIVPLDAAGIKRVANATNTKTGDVEKIINNINKGNLPDDLEEKTSKAPGLDKVNPEQGKPKTEPEKKPNDGKANSETTPKK